jgi:hypothetical protein
VWIASLGVRYAEFQIDVNWPGEAHPAPESSSPIEESSLIYALKNANDSIIASDTLTVLVTKNRYRDCEYRALLPPECIHSQGRYLLRVELPLHVDMIAGTDDIIDQAAVVSVRTYLDGKLLHEGPYKHRYWQLSELMPGSHDFEIQVVDELVRPMLRGFRESFSVREGPRVGAPDGMCDFDPDPGETLFLRATGLPSQEAVHLSLSGPSTEIELASPIEGDCLWKEAPIRLSMKFPLSVTSGREQLLLITVDGSAALVSLNDTELPACFEIDAANIVNPRPGFSAEHILKVSVVTSGWTLLAESLPVRLGELSTHVTCKNRTFPWPDTGCVRLPFPRQPSTHLVGLIEKGPSKPNCSLNGRIDGVWSHGRFVPFFCRIPELSVPAAQACIQNRSIVLAGTSVVRGLFFGLLQRLGAETGIESRLPVTQQRNAQGKVVASNWWRRRAEMNICPKQPASVGVSGRCRSGCWSCMHTVGDGRIAYVWTRTTLSDRFESISR